MKRFAYAVVLMALCAGTAFAMQDPEGAAEAANEPNLAVSILSAVLGGAMAVFVGWMKNHDVESDEHEKFDFKHAWPALIIGALVGLVGYFTDQGPKDVVGMLEASPFYGILVFGLEAAWKALFRNTAPLIRKAIKAVKAGADESDPSQPPSGPSS